MKKIILIGNGGHCKSCIDVIESSKKFEIIGMIDINSVSIGKYKTIGKEKNLTEIFKQVKNAHIAIGKIKNSKLRFNYFEKLKRIGFIFPTIISPYSYVSKNAFVGEGTIIMHGAIVNAYASIGKNCIINSKSLIEHDVNIDDDTHVATNATINGSVKIGKGSFIGSSSVIKQGIRVKSNSFIKANQLIKENN